MKRVVHVGEGKHIEIEEGVIFRPPPAPPQKLPQRRPAYPEGKYQRQKPRGKQAIAGDAIPGYKEWLFIRKSQSMSLSPNMGRAPGQQYGTTGRMAKKNMADAKEQVKKDMAAIKAAGIDLDKAGEEALEATLTIMRMKGDLRLKLTAARQVLEWAKAKPVAKSEVTINKAEEWLASLTEEKNDK